MHYRHYFPVFIYILCADLQARCHHGRRCELPVTWSQSILVDIRSSRSAMDHGNIQCSCGRTFAQLNAYTNHHRTCKKRKKGLSSALAKAKLVWDHRKRRCTSDNVGEHVSSSGAIPGVPGVSNTHHDGRQLQENDCQKVGPLCSIRWAACS